MRYNHPMLLHTLGGLELEGADFRRPKPLLLLAYLALEGPQERGHLADLFFSNSDRARANLSVALTRLRGVAPQLITATDNQVSTQVEVDAARLLAMLDRSAVSEGVALYRGRFLAGFETAGLGTELEEWIYSTREFIANRVQQALLTLAEQIASSTRFEDAADYAERAYLLSGAAEPELGTLTRLHTLFVAGEHPKEADVAAEAQAYGFRLAQSTEEARRQLTEGQPATPPSSPYKGLATFREEDAELFFGRDEVVRDLIERVRRQPLVSIIGASGSGKSSLVFAGLIPALRRRGGWLFAHFRPGLKPFMALAFAMLELLEPESDTIERLQQAKRLVALLERGELSLSDLLERLRQQHPEQRPLLIVDQFEELYTFGDSGAGERNFDLRRFLDVLFAGVSGQDDHCSMVLTLRADFLGSVLAYRPMVERLQRSEYLLGPMSDDELREVIETPASLRGVALEDGLTERILHDVSDHDGRLPLLEFALAELWGRQQHRTLTHHAYARMGGVKQALANHAEAVFESLDPAEKLSAQRLFLQLVYPGEGQEDSRRVATHAELIGNWALVTRLASAPARLIVTGRNESGEQTAEIIHEALIQGWNRLRGWIGEHRAFRSWQERLRREIRLWQRNERSDNALLQGFHLDEAARWLEEQGDGIGTEERDYIERSLARNDRLEHLEHARKVERERLQHQSQRRLRLFLGLVTLLLVVVAWQWSRTGLERDRALRAQAFAEEQQRLVVQQSRKALVSQLGTEALRALQIPGPLNGYYDRALLLASQAIRFLESPETYGNLLRIVQEIEGDPHHYFEVQAYRDGPIWMALSPDGRLMATTTVGQHDVTLWDAGTRAPLATLRGAEDQMRTVAFSPDGALLAAGGIDGRILVWNVMTRELRSTFRSNTPPNNINSVAFAPDGHTLASGGQDGTVRIWDVDAGRPVGEPLTGHSAVVTRVAFSPAGLLASASRDQSIVLWDLDEGAALGRLTGHQGTVTGLAFTSDGTRLVSGGLDATVRLWDVTTLRQIGPPRERSISGNGRQIFSLALSPDDSTLATTHIGGNIALWDLDSRSIGPPPLELSTPQRTNEIYFHPSGNLLLSADFDGAVRHWLVEDVRLGQTIGGGELARDVLRLAFTPDGRELLSSDAGGRVEFWDLGAQAPDGEPLRHLAPVWGLDVSPDGSLVATGSNDLTVRLWDAETHAQLGDPLRGHGSGITSVRFSPDGSILASAGLDGTVRLWDVATRTASGQPLRGHEGFVWSLSFHPDGRTLASGGHDGTIVLWDLATRSALGAPLQGHGSDVFSVAFSPDGRLLASGSGDRTVQLWDVTRHERLVGSTMRHDVPVRSVAFSPDGTILASASSDDATLILWNVANGTIIGDFHRTTLPIRDVAFSSAGRYLATASGYTDSDRVALGSVALWPIDPGLLIDVACGLSGRNLSQREWRRYLGDRPYQRTCPNYPEGT